MKTSINKIKIIFCLLAASTLLTTIPANAQWSKYSNYNAGRQHNLFLGFEALAGTRTFSLNSDHIQFNELSVLQEGRTIGMVVGTNSILLKLRQGQY
ncbi:MAG TPA: hypothetical protein PKC24_02185, partial [Cyclobacteriaceae bacterium]|nr:hypothetical protein [Cyclobacteriaceae bacterium]